MRYVPVVAVIPEHLLADTSFIASVDGFAKDLAGNDAIRSMLERNGWTPDAMILGRAIGACFGSDDA